MPPPRGLAAKVKQGATHGHGSSSGETETDTSQRPGFASRRPKTRPLCGPTSTPALLHYVTNSFAQSPEIDEEIGLNGERYMRVKTSELGFNADNYLRHNVRPCQPIR
jgi:hypothetical protein